MSTPSNDNGCAASIATTKSHSIVPLSEFRVNLGMPEVVADQLLRTGSPARVAIELLFWMVQPLESLLFLFLSLIPARLQRMVIVIAWWFWVTLHRIVPARISKRGLVDSLSMQAHAMGNIYWLVRLVPVTVKRTRFGLQQMGILYPLSGGVKQEVIDIPEQGVRGLYLHTAPESLEDPPVLFWILGGAYVGGDTKSNSGLAERYARQLGADVFLTHQSLFPENTIEDAHQDACRAYEWLLSRKAAEKVIVLGISSGGGSAMRLLQLAKENESVRSRFFNGVGKAPQPAGAVLVGPFVNYTDREFAHKHIDWLVTQRLYEWVYPLSGAMCGGADRKREVSPLFQRMEGLAPVCISCSDHEACTDESKQLAQELTKVGNSVKLFTHPYLCHAFQMFSYFLPEAQEAEDEMVAWMRSRGPVWAEAAAAVTAAH